MCRLSERPLETMLKIEKGIKDSQINNEVLSWHLTMLLVCMSGALINTTVYTLPKYGTYG